jgi:hypothetical protein
LVEFFGSSCPLGLRWLWQGMRAAQAVYSLGDGLHRQLITGGTGSPFRFLSSITASNFRFYEAFVENAVRKRSSARNRRKFTPRFRSPSISKGTLSKTTVELGAYRPRQRHLGSKKTNRIPTTKGVKPRFPQGSLPLRSTFRGETPDFCSILTVPL